MTTILILNYKGYDDTILAIESVLKSSYMEYKIVVVDNDSPNNSMDYFLSWAKGDYQPNVDKQNILNDLCTPFISKPLSYTYYEKEHLVDVVENGENPSITFIQSGKNLGFAGGNNVGISYILKQHRTEFIWLLNPDTLIKEDTLDVLISYAQQQDKKMGIIGTALLYYDAPSKLQALGATFNTLACTGIHIHGHEDYDSVDLELFDTKQMDLIIGASMLVRPEVFQSIGLLEDKYFLYYEEIDFATRAKRAGYHLGMATQSIVYHKEGASINSENPGLQVSAFSDFYAMRNRILFTKKFNVLLLPFVYGGLLLSSLLRVKRGEYQKAFTIIKIIFGKREFTT